MLLITALAVGAVVITLSPRAIRFAADFTSKETYMALMRLTRTLVVTQAFLAHRK